MKTGRQQDNIKRYLKETGCKGADWKQGVRVQTGILFLSMLFNNALTAQIVSVDDSSSE